VVVARAGADAHQPQRDRLLKPNVVQQTHFL
jgi:hypothetical protein